MDAIRTAPPPAEIAGSIAALRHHLPMAAKMASTLPLINNASIAPLPLGSNDPRDIQRALALDTKLLSYEVYEAFEQQLADALNGPPANADALGRLLPLMFAGRSAGRAEAIPARLAVLMELVAFERDLRPFTADVVVLAVLNDLRTNKFAPDPCDFIASLNKAREQISTVADGLRDLIEVRASVDDVLIGAGLRECPPGTWDIPDHYDGMPDNAGHTDSRS